MNCILLRVFRPLLRAVGVSLLVNLWAISAGAAMAAEKLAFPEKFVFRLSYYSVRDADTDLTVLSSSSNLGTGFSFVDDLGGDESVAIPRIDAYYRIDDRHRVEFSSFRIERDGKNLLTIDLDIGDESYSVGDTVISEINYELFKIGYAYSFHRSQQVELGITLGLNVTSYEFDYELVDGSSADNSDASGPLPMFGIRMSYAINPRLSLHYFTEVFFIEVSDAEGSFQNYELEFQYRMNNRFMLGAGVTWFSIDLTSEDRDWNGRIADNHKGIMLSASYYLG